VTGHPPPGDFIALGAKSQGSEPKANPALRFNQKYLYLCSEDGRRSYGAGTAWG